MNARAMRILAALDGTTESETLLAAIMPLVRTSDLEVVLFRAVGGAEEAVPARAYLARLRAALALHRVRAECRVEVGPPADSILRLLGEDAFDFAAMTTHGRRGIDRMLMGSVAESVIRSSGVPIIVNRPDARVGDWRKIVVPLDGSLEAEAILDDVKSLAARSGSTLFLINVGEVFVAAPGLEFAYGAVSVPDLKPYLDRIAGSLSAAGLNVKTRALFGSPGPEIVRYAEEEGAGLIALTTHGRGGVRRVILGSVAERVLRTAPCAVLVRPLEPKPGVGKKVVAGEVPAAG